MSPMSSFLSKQQKQQKQNKSRKNLQQKLIKSASAPMRKANRKRGPLSQPRGSNLGNKISNRATNRRTQVIEEDEYIGEVLGSVSFVSTSYPINPGQSATFPWGSKIASLYDEYEFEYLEFYYKREVSEFSTNGQAGKVILSALYDATAPTPTTKQMVEDSWPHIDGMPCTEQILLRLDCARMKANDSHYVRYGAQPANTDLKTYDAGQLFVSTYGNTNATVVGELHVRYRVKFAEPILEPADVAGGVAHASSIAATTANNFAAAVVQPGSSGNFAFTLGINTIVFPANYPGNYLILCTVSGATSASAFSLSGGTALNLFTSGAVRDATSEQNSVAGTTTYSTYAASTVSIPVGGATITSSASTIVGTGSMDLWVISLPTALLTAPNPMALFPPLAEIQEMRDLVSELRELKMHHRLIEVRSDSDFEEEAYPMGSSSTPPRAKGADPLSQSTLGLIGELIARKSAAK
jgi:hypothetical protein